MSIPLVQNNEKDSINTSIIAIKRNIERINMLLGLSNSEEIDTSEFVKKSDIVDEVTVGNMQSVTSNAVAKCLSYSTEEVFTGEYWKDGKKIYKKVYSFINKQFPYHQFTNLITDTNIDTLVFWDDVVISGKSGTSYYLKSNAYAVQWESGTKRLQAYQTFTGGTVDLKTFDLIVKYTKTTN